MHILINDDLKKFKDLEILDTFKFGNSYYIKVTGIYAVDLTTKFVKTFYDEPCRVLKSELKIDG